MKPTQWIWQDGQLKDWAQAQVHVMAHGLHYGSTVFEGIRSYETQKGPAIFRLEDHIKRLFASCKMYHMTIPYTQNEIAEACKSVVRENELTNSYIRPLVYCDVGGLGLAPLPEDTIGVAVGAIEFGPLLGEDTLEKGAELCVSSWSRQTSASNPMMAKAGGHYLTSQLISREARQNGFSDGISVNDKGIITEGSGANIFIVRNDTLYTPPLGLSILEGLTRDSVMKIAKADGIPVVECNIPRESLYTSDEIFLCGTAAEITPVNSVDRIEIGSGKTEAARGSITRHLQRRFFDHVSGRVQDHFGWLTYVDDSASLSELNGRSIESAGTLSY